MTYKLPVNYTKLPFHERRAVREQYITEQDNKCFYCGADLNGKVPKHIISKPINWKLFPSTFMKYPVHLQHCHKTGMTEGAVHAYCNAVMWQYENK